jgi:hypothetical protein
VAAICLVVSVTSACAVISFPDNVGHDSSLAAYKFLCFPYLAGYCDKPFSAAWNLSQPHSCNLW